MVDLVPQIGSDIMSDKVMIDFRLGGGITVWVDKDEDRDVMIESGYEALREELKRNDISNYIEDVDVYE